MEQNISSDELVRLINGCLSGDRNSQKQIYQVYGQNMMSLCLRYSKNREEAEEVLQDGFVNMYRRMNQFKNNGSFEGWLRKIMINCALQNYRRRKNSMINVVPINLDSSFPSREINLMDAIYEKELINLIQSLPDTYRMVFNLYVFEGMKHREIAALLKISEGTSKSNLFDARLILKKHLSVELKIAR
ncbi:MAG TPA: sigma-70 family RNA polymerase sigma factor [Chitinophagaceae bacterium]|jgi:RNA polymerase sigma-70 factor (ECF subfamily)